MAKARKSNRSSAPDPAPIDPDAVTVYVVDDDEAMRDSLVFLFKSVGRQVRPFDSAEAFLEVADENMRGCAVLDVRMPGMSGLELQQQLAQRRVPLPVILLTGHADVPMAVRAMRIGAFDFIEKPCNDQLLLDRVSQAITHDREHRSQHAVDRDIADRLEELSPREREVMDLVVAGKLNKQIAADLGISIKTVEVHRARVMEKMQAGGLAELVRMAIAAGA